MPYQGLAFVLGLGIGIAAAAFLYFLSEQERMRQEQPYGSNEPRHDAPNSWTSSNQTCNGQPSSNDRRRRRRNGGYQSGSVAICAICHDTMNGTPLKTLICTHQFHLQCIERWCQIRRECPCCRSSI